MHILLLNLFYFNRMEPFLTKESLLQFEIFKELKKFHQFDS